MAKILIDSGPPWLGILFALPAAGAALRLLVGRDGLARRLGPALALAVFLCALPLLFGFDSARPAFQFVRLRAWIPQLRVSYAVGVDGLSLPLLLLVTGLMPLCLLAAGREEAGARARMACLLVLESALVGCLAALDFVLLALCWTTLLAPLAVLAALGDGEGGPASHAELRSLAAARFLLCGLAASIPLLAAGAALAQAGDTCFIPTLAGRGIGPVAQVWVFAAIALACAQRLPLPPLRGWLAPLAEAAPTAAAALAVFAPLSGLYGLLRLAPLAPDACLRFSGPLLWLGAAGLLLGGVRALAAALAHGRAAALVAGFVPVWMGLAVIGAFAGARPGLEGAILAVFALALVAVGLVLCDSLTTHHPGNEPGHRLRRAAAILFPALFALAGAGLPGTAAFPALVSIFAAMLSAQPALVLLVAPGLMLLAAALCLWLRQVWGTWATSSREISPCGLLILAPPALTLLGLGLYPQPLLGILRRALDALAPAVTP